jgi:hypothetical protein
MEIFRSIGEDLNERWHRTGRCLESFPALASAVLKEHDPSRHVEPNDIIGRLLEEAELPRQAIVDIEFPFTLYRGEGFNINAYFWVDGTLDIHDHAFWGAFQVIAGSSIHVLHTYTEHSRISPDLHRGQLSRQSIEELKQGTVREIVPGRDFIHALFHLERPSVTVVVATDDDPRCGAIYSYLTPGLAVNFLAKNPKLELRSRTLALVAAACPSDYPSRVAQLVTTGDPEEAFHGLLHAFQTLDGDGFSKVLQAAGGAHPSCAELWESAFEENRRQANIVERRKFVHDPTHRFFLAVILNAPDRATILRMMGERFPELDPLESIMRSVRELAGIAVDGPLGPTAIGVPLGEAELIVLRSLIADGRESAVVAALEREFGEAEVREQRDEIRELISAFRSSLFFKPLLSMAEVFGDERSVPEQPSAA